MECERIIFGANILESVKNYKNVYQILETLKNCNIKFIDTAPTYDFGYINKYIGEHKGYFKVISKISLRKSPRTWVPFQLFPLFKKLFNRKYFRYIFNFIYTPVEVKSDDFMSHEKSLKKSLKDCNVDYFYTCLFHEDGNKFDGNKNISSYLKSINEKGLAKNIGISLHGNYTIEEITNLISFNPWIKSIMLPIESNKYCFNEIVELVNTNQNINFAVRGFYNAFNEEIFEQIKKFINASKSNSKVVFSTSKKERIIELVEYLKKIN